MPSLHFTGAGAGSARHFRSRQLGCAAVPPTDAQFVVLRCGDEISEGGSTTPIFLQATGKSLKTATMRDREFVNRFCAFQILDLDEYRDMDEFLAKGLRKMNTAPDRLPELSSRFRRGLANNFRLFGRNAFRKQPDQEQRGVLNASLWDVMSTGLSGYEMRVVEQKSDALRAGFFRLLDDDDFKVSITYGTNDPKKVRHRFSAAGAMIREVFDAGSP